MKLHEEGSIDLIKYVQETVPGGIKNERKSFEKTMIEMVKLKTMKLH